MLNFYLKLIEILYREADKFCQFFKCPNLIKWYIFLLNFNFLFIFICIYCCLFVFPRFCLFIFKYFIYNHILHIELATHM